MDKLTAFVFAALAIFCVVLVGAFLFAVITQMAWSGSVGQIFHLPDISFMQAFWLNVLGGMVCKGSSVKA